MLARRSDRTPAAADEPLPEGIGEIDAAPADGAGDDDGIDHRGDPLADGFEPAALAALPPRFDGDHGGVIGS
jgi:hypothetical protein